MNLGLIQNGMLFGLLALAIPLIIHLLFRQKPRDVQIGSVRFLREVMEKHRNRRKVMRWLLMSLRMLGLALLALLFARPFMTERDTGTKGQKLVAILIDRSASMQLRADGTRLVDTAIEEAEKLIRNAKGKTQFAVAYFDHEVEPIKLPDSADTNRDLLRTLEAPKDSYSATDYAAAFRWAHDVCTNSKAEQTELHVMTDLQQSGLAWSEVEPMPASVLVKVHDLGRDLPNNVAIVGSTPKQLVVRPGETTTIECSLLNAGPFPLEEMPVVLEIKNGKRTIHKRERLKLEPGSFETVTFELPELEDGLWQGSITAEAHDDIVFDNKRYVAILSAPQYRVLVIDGQPNDSKVFSETYHLCSALRLAPQGATYSESPYLPDLTSKSEPLSNFDVVVLANVERVPEDNVRRLRQFIDQGGGVLVFAGEQVSSRGYQDMSEAGLVPGEIVTPREAFDLPWRVGEWDESHSVFQLFNDPQYGDLRKLPFRGITEMKADDDALVVASFSDGNPFVLEKRIGDAGGSLLWVNTSVDSEWSTWTESEMFVPIMHQMLGHLTGLNSGGPVQEKLIDTGQSDGLRVDNKSAVGRVPGIFAKTKSHHVVNVSPRESETERCSVEDFVKRFELNTESVSQQIPKVQMASFGSPLDLRPNEVWHWVLFGLVTVFVGEFFLSNRTVA